MLLKKRNNSFQKELLILLVYLLLQTQFLSAQINEKNIITYQYQNANELRSVLPDSSVYEFQKLNFLVDSLIKVNSENFDSLFIYKVLIQERIGNIYHQQNKFFLAQNYYQNAIQLSEEYYLDSLTAENYFNVAELYLENGSSIEAIKNYQKALRIYKKINSIDGIFWTHIGLGIVYRKCGNSKYSLENYEEAVEIGNKGNDPFYLAVVYNNLGNLYRQQGLYEKAREALQLSLVNCEAHGNPLYTADCNHSIGDLLKEYKDYEKALTYYKTALDITIRENDNYRKFQYYASLASVYLIMDKDEEALSNFSKSMELAKSVGDKGRLSEILILISEFYKKNGEYDKTKINLLKALSIAEEVKDSLFMASSLLELVKLKFDQGEFLSAKKNAETVFQISSEKGILNIQKEAAYYLSEIYDKTKDYKKAHYYVKIHSTLSDSLLNSQKIKIIEETEAKYNLAQMEKEKLEAANSALAAENQLQIRNLILLVVGSLTLVILIFLIRFIVKRKKEKIVSEQKSKNLKRKLDLMQSQLDAKNRELTSKAIIISDNSKILEEISNKIGNYLEGGSTEKNDLRKLKNNLKDSYKEKYWEDFLKHFEEVHPDFYKRLSKLVPHLSTNEQKICAFLRMNLNTKEMAQITHQSTKSIEVARSRIRKKIGLEKEEGLSNYIQTI